MINTLNESALHKTLKMMYSLEVGDRTEIQIDNWICDVVTKNNEIIEIQTANLSKLLPKIKSLVSKNYKVKIIYPLVIEKYIEIYRFNIITNEKTIISYRKSPKKQNIYHLFKELTGLYEILLNPNFELTVLAVSITEERQKLDTVVQTKNHRRRFLKDWIKTGKRLNEILEEHSFKNENDYFNLIPKSCTEPFYSKDIVKNCDVKITDKDARLFIWVLYHLGILEQLKGRPIKYRILKKSHII